MTDRIGYQDAHMTWTLHEPTLKEKQEQEQERQKIKDKIRRRVDIQTSTPLECNECGADLGWVHECDLNGSYFFCHVCKGKNALL